MALTVELLDSLDGVGADELFALDGTLGALGCRARLEQHTGDPRWAARYVVARDGDRLVAAVPIFLGNARGLGPPRHGRAGEERSGGWPPGDPG
jgi:hypothetical protein